MPALILKVLNVLALPLTLLGPLLCQESAQESLAKDLQQSHQHADAPAYVDRFRATIKVTSRGKRKDTITVELDIIFGNSVVYDPKRRGMAMIRYALNEQGRRVERGRDRRGPWLRKGDKVESLTARGDRQDAELVSQHMRLCQQLLQFLDPAKVLRSMQGKPKVSETKLWVSHALGEVACRFVEGSVEGFPVYGEGGVTRAWLQMWVEKKKNRLVAIKVWPLDENGKRKLRAEFVRLQDYEWKSDIAMPTRLVIDAVEGKKTRPEVMVTLRTITLNPELTAADFKRSK